MSGTACRASHAARPRGRWFPAAALLLASWLSCGGAAAIETYHTCDGTITSLPATVSTPGTWCFDRDLATGIASGNVITIAVDDVTLDCNGFKLGGLAAGPSTQAVGISATSRNRVTVRNCNLRGFRRGIFLGGAGNLAEDNRLDGIRFEGIFVKGAARRNRVYDTGPGGQHTRGMSGSGEFVDNIVSGLTTGISGATAYGIVADGHRDSVRGNRISGMDSLGTSSIAIHAGDGARVVDNHLVFHPSSPRWGTGISSRNPADRIFCSGNTVVGANVAFTGHCIDVGRNAEL